jgi:hypothetical protein
MAAALDLLLLPDGTPFRTKTGRTVRVIRGAAEDPPAGGETPPAGDGKPAETPPPANEAEGRGSKEAVLADLARERDRRQAAEAKVQELEREKLEPQQRVEAERDDARKEAERLRAELARFRVGARHGLSEQDVADISTEGTPEEFEARVQRLAQRLGAGTQNGQQTPPPSAGGLPPSPNAHRDGSASSAGVQAGRDAYAARKQRVTT